MLSYQCVFTGSLCRKRKSIGEKNQIGDGVEINLWNKVEFFGRGGKKIEVGDGRLVPLVSEEEWVGKGSRR